jgi:hypothetical protein
VPYKLYISCGDVAGHEELLPTWQLFAFAGTLDRPTFRTSDRTIAIKIEA